MRRFSGQRKYRVVANDGLESAPQRGHRAEITSASAESEHDLQERKLRGKDAVISETQQNSSRKEQQRTAYKARKKTIDSSTQGHPISKGTDVSDVEKTMFSPLVVHPDPKKHDGKVGASQGGGTPVDDGILTKAKLPSNKENDYLLSSRNRYNATKETPCVPFGISTRLKKRQDLDAPVNNKKGVLPNETTNGRIASDTGVRARLINGDRKACRIAQRDYWNKVLSSQCHCTLKTADCLIHLGNSQLQLREHEEALVSFKESVHIRRKQLGDKHIAFGRALERVGLACAKTGDNDWAMAALNESLQIRFDKFGPWHVDVADTLNNMAGIHLKRGELGEARAAYEEVLSVRKAVFGQDHPSVAVTLYTLASIWMRCNEFDEALMAYEETLRIYRESLKLKEDHRLIARVTRDVSSLERLHVSLGF